MAKGFKEKICERCGKNFIPNSNNQKYCCEECKKEKAKEYNKNRNLNPKRLEYNKQYKKIWYENNIKPKLKGLTTKICPVCNKLFTQTAQNQKYCSKECLIKIKRIQHLKSYHANKNNYKDKNKEYKRNWTRNKYNSDLQFKLTYWVRDQVKRCLKSQKTKYTFDILGYTPEQLKQRLEMNFKPDMTWENHGTLWHIDHRKPLCKFNFVLPDGTSNYEQIRLANSLANLQPLYVTENLSKGGKFI